MYIAIYIYIYIYSFIYLLGGAADVGIVRVATKPSAIQRSAADTLPTRYDVSIITPRIPLRHKTFCNPTRSAADTPSIPCAGLPPYKG